MSEVERSAIFGGIEMGIGTWSWGDRLIWNYGTGYDYEDIHQAFSSAVEFGFRFFDTAEIYGQGRSETYLGNFVRETKTNLVIASKFMPFPWRLSAGSLKKALAASLKRLQLDRISLYQMHQSFPPVKIETWMGQMADVVHSGLVGAVGVSNYDLNQTWQAQNALIREGLRLASTQMEYNLLNRRIEKSGLMDLCREQGITVIAYSPLAMGMLSGKYNPNHPPSGYRAVKYSAAFLDKLNPLITELRRMGLDHDGKTPSQVALNWVICKGAIPIPGEKNPHQVEENAGALGWHLNEDEVAQLDQISEKISDF
ncbi:MAG: aldo/keto reductase [Anaerolineaceae bacterium]|jgi:aryl-alcohol dehydrogenase-like predicted oxidoreductase